MSVGQTTVFPNEKDHARNPPWRNGEQGVRCFTVTFLVEGLGDAPNEPRTLRKFEVLSAGKPLRFADESDYQQWFDYRAFQDFLDFSKPKVSDPKRAGIMRFVRFGAVPNLEPLSLVIETGFAQDIQKFRFDSIRLK